jgi:hypothetical protein
MTRVNSGKARWKGTTSKQRSKAMRDVVMVRVEKQKKEKSLLERIREEIKNENNDKILGEAIRSWFN